MSKPLPQLFDRLGLPPELIDTVLEYARLSMTPKLTKQTSDRLEEILKLAEQYAVLDLVLNQIDDWCLYTANPSQSLVLNEDRIDELVWLYALLSSQPTLSEYAAYQISQILDLATQHEPLALLLNEIDRFVLESSDFMSDEAQHEYANQASRILEFVAPNLDSENSEQLLTVLSDQCSDNAKLTPKSEGFRFRLKLSPQGCVVSALIGAAAFVVGLAISHPELGQLPLNSTVDKTLSVKMSAAAAGGLRSNFSKRESLQTVQTVNVVQQRFEDQQSKFEDEQFELEGKQQQAERYQLLAESQHQYQEAQQWHQAAHHYLQLSQQMKAKAQEKLQSAQSSLNTLSEPVPPKPSPKVQQPHLDRGFIESWAVMLSLIGSSLLTATLILIWSCMDARKREFG